MVKGVAGVYFGMTGIWNIVSGEYSWAHVAMVGLGAIFLFLTWIDPLRNEMIFGKKPEPQDPKQDTEENSDAESDADPEDPEKSHN